MKDIDLLYNDIDKLIEKYQSTIEIIINKFIRSGYMKYADKDDLKQDINEELLLKIPKIKNNYNGTCSLNTYISAIIRNICLEKIRKIQTATKKLGPEVITEQIIYNSAPDNLAMADELDRLKVILVLFDKQKAKFELCLKLLFRIPVCEEDICNYLEINKLDDFKNSFEILNNENTLTDNHLYDILTKIFNKKEKKYNSSDAIRKWIKARIDETIYLMNGNPKRANYDKESLKLLVELYFYKKVEIISI
jgi:RNA polymerase sigma factor (sigma-70 family)